MESKWTGAVEGSFFSPEVLDKRRVIQQAETKYSNKTAKDGYYVIGVDVGRFGCTSEAVVLKVQPQPTGVPAKSVVNIYSFEEEHFGKQAIQIKRLFRDFHAKIAVIDANGLDCA